MNLKNKITIWIKNKNKYYIALFVLLVILCYLFPYSHDDWAWGSTIGLERLYTFFSGYNGRWAGNLLVIFLTRNRVIKSFFISISLTLIVYFIKKIVNDKDEKITLLSIILMLAMPLTTIVQVLVWTSAFSNYVIPVLIVLIIIYYSKNLFSNQEIKSSKKISIIFFVLGTISSLFVENITVFNLIFSLGLIIYSKIRKSKIPIQYFTYFIGVLIGASLMFSNNSYYNIMIGVDDYRQASISIKKVIKTYCSQFYQLFIIKNKILNILLSFGIIGYLIKKIDKTKKTKIYYIELMFFGMFISFNIFLLMFNSENVFIINKFISIFEKIISVIYVINILISIIVFIKDIEIKRRIVVELLSIIIMALPLLFVEPIGPRCFFPTYIMWILITCEIINCSWNNELNRTDELIAKALIISFIIFYILSYIQIYKVETERNNYIKNNLNCEKLILPELPNKDLVWLGNKPNNKMYEDRFKMYYGINKNTEIEFVSYEKWKRDK